MPILLGYAALFFSINIERIDKKSSTVSKVCCFSNHMIRFHWYCSKQLFRDLFYENGNEKAFAENSKVQVNVNKLFGTSTEKYLFKFTRVVFCLYIMYDLKRE